MATQPVQPAEPKRQRGLKFCPNTSDLLYPRENKGKRVLEYYCKNCDYVEEAAKQDWYAPPLIPSSSRGPTEGAWAGGCA